YGQDGALLVTHPTAGHAPRTGSPADADWFWRNVFAFLDAPTSSAGLPSGIETDSAGSTAPDPPLGAGLPLGIEFQPPIP
ncbi:MAG: hypothetical protein AAFY88_11665, partial [Acidobacteriota bacterium]